MKTSAGLLLYFYKIAKWTANGCYKRQLKLQANFHFLPGFFLSKDNILLISPSRVQHNMRPGVTPPGEELSNYSCDHSPSVCQFSQIQQVIYYMEYRSHF